MCGETIETHCKGRNDISDSGETIKRLLMNDERRCLFKNSALCAPTTIDYFVRCEVIDMTYCLKFNGIHYLNNNNNKFRQTIQGHRLVQLCCVCWYRGRTTTSQIE